MSNYEFTIRGGVMSQKSSKQICIIQSIMESNFIALDKARKEAKWIHNFFEGVSSWTKTMMAIIIQCS